MIIILDRAHGIDVAGKRSPDSRLIEWQWSQQFIKRLMAKLSNYNHLTVICPFIHQEKEPGLTARVETYNALVSKYGDALMISPHCNAAPGEGWINKANGFEVWTSKGQDESDKVAEVFVAEIKKMFPDIKMRTDTTDGDSDKEANFTVLWGYKLRSGQIIKAKYKGVLIENLFQTCQRDVDLLLDEFFNEKLVDAYTTAILKLCQKTEQPET